MAHSLLEVLSDVLLKESDMGEHWEEEGQEHPNEIVVVLDEERSTDVISLDSSEQSLCSSPRPSKDLIAYEVMVNQRNIEDVCICCGDLQIHTQHPLFYGGMCIPCKDNFLESFFLYEEDGYQSFCTICCSGKILLTCENSNCNRCYCFECVDALVNPGSSAKFQAMSNWICFLCLPLTSENGLLRKRRKWRENLKDFYNQESQRPLEMYETVPAWKRKPIQVLSLFGDIEEELVKCGFLGNIPGNGRLKHLNDVSNVVRKDVEEWGPFDLIYGSTPPIGQISEHPPVWYFLQYYRVLQYGKPKMNSEQPFFWMFVDNLVLTKDDREIASRFFETDPATIYEVCDEMVKNAVLIWSNIPCIQSIGFFLFLLGCLRAAVMEEIYGMVGGDVDLSCISPGKKHFDLNKISVYWQTKNEPLKTINAYIPGDDTSQYIDSKYQNRTSLKLEKMERGDFSLHLSNITIKDELELECIVVNKSSTDPLFRSTVNLRVAANYSIPVVEAPKKTNDTEVTFTCTSHNGFPKPKIYWVNKTDNSLLNQSLQNDTFTINEKGLYSVSSVLKIAWTPNIRVECCIENVNLQQNLTVQSSFLLSPDGSTDHRIITTTPNQSIPSGKTSIITFFIIFGIVLVILLMAVISFRKLHKNKHHYGDYRGPQGNRQMAETTDYI